MWFFLNLKFVPLFKKKKQALFICKMVQMRMLHTVRLVDTLGHLHRIWRRAIIIWPTPNAICHSNMNMYCRQFWMLIIRYVWAWNLFKYCLILFYTLEFCFWKIFHWLKKVSKLQCFLLDNKIVLHNGHSQVLKIAAYDNFKFYIIRIF